MRHDGSECTVWWASPDDAYPACYALLQPHERVRAEAYSAPLDQKRFVVGSALTRIVAGNHLSLSPHSVEIDRSCDDCGRQHGKPKINGHQVHVSVAHSGDLVAVAVDPVFPVGIDIEKPNSSVRYSEFLTDILTPAEKNDVRKSEAVDCQFALLRYWVRKEAVLKATGIGLKVPMTNLEVTHPAEEAKVRWMAGVSDSVALLDLANRAGHLVSIAFMERLKPPVVIERSGTDLLREFSDIGI